MTESGLGCPDWPLCHGQLIPPFEFTTLIEYSHRLSASVLSVFVLATTVMAWMYYRHRRWVFVPSVLAFAMVIVAAVLGGATVLTELAWWFVLLHLGIAEVLVACLIIAGVAGWHSEDSLAGDAYDSPSIINLELLTLATVAGVFGLILSGSYMVGYGAGSSCPVWPGCLDDDMMPQGTAFAIHMGHRIVAALVGVLLLVTSMVALSRRSSIPSVAWSGGFLIFVFGIQVMLGAATVWSGFTAETKAIHLSAATLVWVALIFMLSLIYLPRLYSTESSIAIRR